MVYNRIHSKGKFSVVVENKQALQEHFIFPLIQTRRMFTRVICKMKRLDLKAIHNFTDHCIEETGFMKCHQAESLAAVLVITVFYQRLTPKEISK